VKNNKKKKMSMKEVLHINLRAIGVFYKYYPQMIFSRIFYCCWQALTPYVGIWFSARILTELSGDKNPERLTRLVLLTLITTAVTMLGSGLLDKWRKTATSGIRFKHEMPYVFKMLQMDFQDVDAPDNHALLHEIRQARNQGWGLFRLLENMNIIFTSVFTLLGGLVMTVSLFTSRVPESAGAYTILNQPLFLLFVLAVMIAITYASPLLSTKARSYWAKHAGEMSQGNRHFWFYAFSFGQQPGLAADNRIYRQERFAQRFFADKENGFGSKGFFAKLARGPIGGYQAAASAVSVIFTGIAYAFVCLKAWAGAFGIGAVTQYVAAITKVATGAADLLREYGDISNNAEFLKTSLKFLDIPNRMYQGTIPVEKCMDNEYEIAFKNVSFKYPGSETYALKNLSFTFKIGQKLAVVGMNGSGKTTMIKLLCRLYDPTEGEITLNGIDIRKYDYKEYLSIFSVVFQDFKLFSFSLGQNVAANVKVDEAKATECLEKAGFGERLKSLPKGLDTYLSKDFEEDGIGFSGGEAQKVALARALYKDSPFIILDEPTAALDPIAEAEIYSKFNDIVGDKTAIYISHRLSSCRFCDEIVVFDHGEVVQQGSHDMLVVDERGKYHELWNAQVQYYI